MSYEVKRHGENEGFDTGAVRDTRDGKGRFDLISPAFLVGMAATSTDPLAGIIWHLGHFLDADRSDMRLNKAAWALIDAMGGYPNAMRRLAVVYEAGARKYADRNWEKGMPLSRCLDSALRHTHQLLAGDTDEDHAGHALWNVAALLHYREMIARGVLSADLDDLPALYNNYYRSPAA